MVTPEGQHRPTPDARDTIQSCRPRAIARAARAMLAEQANWSQRTLNLSPAEGLMSRTARRALDSDLASRLSEGLPWDKDRSMPAAMHQWSVRLEKWISQLSRDLFGARFTDWRPVSNTMANAVALSAVTSRGDLVAVQDLNAGGNASYQPSGVSGVLGLETLTLPGRPDFDIDTTSAVRLISERMPRAVVVGGSKVLFRYELETIAAAARSVGAHLVFDAAHVGPLVAAGVFNQPLAEGATLMTVGTHKLMGGPVGGLVLTDDEAVAERMYACTEPRFLQTRDINKYAAAVIALAELVEYRFPLAEAIQRNVAALSADLASAGVKVVGADRGWSQTHMLVADVGPGAVELCADLASNGLLVSACALHAQDAAAGHRSGLRMSVAQLTRRGMRPPEMHRVASLILQVMSGQSPAEQAAELALGFPDVQYSFDEEAAG